MPTHGVPGVSFVAEPEKANIFPARFEFVGVDVCPDGNRPACSKHVLLETWPEPTEG